MRFTAFLARHGLFTPPKEKVEKFQQYFADAVQKEDVGFFDVLRLELPVLSRAHGFFIDVVVLLSSCLHSHNADLVLAALDMIRTVVKEYGKNLSAFSVARLLSDLVLLYKPDHLTYTMARDSVFKIIEVNPNFALYPLKRLMATSGEHPRLEVIGLLFQYVTSAKRCNEVVVSLGCSIALEGLFCPSTATRVAALNLIYALWYKGTPREVLVKFFVKRNVPEELSNAIRDRLQRRYKPPLVPSAMPQQYAQSDADLTWAQDTSMGSDYEE